MVFERNRLRWMPINSCSRHDLQKRILPGDRMEENHTLETSQLTIYTVDN